LDDEGIMVGFEGLSGNRMLDQSITGFDPKRTFAESTAPRYQMMKSATVTTC
jgi:hypothetical protein